MARQVTLYSPISRSAGEVTEIALPLTTTGPTVTCSPETFAKTMPAPSVSGGSENLTEITAGGTSTTAPSTGEVLTTSA